MPNNLTPQNLCKLVETSFDKYQHVRKARAKFLSQYCGRWYARNKPGDAEERKASPINLIFQAVTTLVPNLVFRDPRFKVRSEVLAFRGYADMLELAVNKVVKDIRFREEMRKVILDALFFAGFMKTGIATTGQFITIGNQNVAVGEVFAERVDPDDMILDPLAKDWDEQLIIGNRFRVLRQDLLDSGLYDNDFIQTLQSRTDNKVSFEAAYLSGDKSAELREIFDYVDLAEIYVPRDQRVITIPWTKGFVSDRFLRDVDWSGPKRGPYHMLGFHSAPDNLLPIPSVSYWYDLHVLGNRIARKIARQADRLKRILAYEGEAIEDAERIADADDGETVKVNNIGGIKEINFGGTTEDAYGFMQYVKNEFSTVTNNLDQLSGQQSNAPTATQSEMLQNNSSVRLADLQNQVYNFTADIGTDIGFYLHTDPLIELPLVRRVQGQDTQVHYTPEQRQGDFYSYVLSVQPMSMARPDPNLKVQHLLQFATSVIPAAAQAFQVLGPAFQIQPFLERMALEIGLEEFDEIINISTFHNWIMSKIVQETDPSKAKMFMTAPPDQSMPFLQGGQQPNINVGQPNPGATGPSPQNLNPGTERAQAQQQVAGQLQRAYPTTSAYARAQNM